MSYYRDRNWEGERGASLWGSISIYSTIVLFILLFGLIILKQLTIFRLNYFKCLIYSQIHVIGLKAYIWLKIEKKTRDKRKDYSKHNRLILVAILRSYICFSVLYEYRKKKNNQNQ